MTGPEKQLEVLTVYFSESSWRYCSPELQYILPLCYGRCGIHESTTHEDGTTRGEGQLADYEVEYIIRSHNIQSSKESSLQNVMLPTRMLRVA